MLRSWKKDRYTAGVGCLDRIGEIASLYGKNILAVANTGSGGGVTGTLIRSLERNGAVLSGNRVCPGAKPNAPREDVYRIATYILQYRPDAVLAVGGGSTIDACKAASVLATLGGRITPEIDAYFGTGKVSAALEKTGLSLVPVVAVETSASSGSHLTKYSNITDPAAGQKKLIVDEAIVPDRALFDYETTYTMPLKVTIDGALDAIAHTVEVFCGAKGGKLEKAGEIAETAVTLVVENAGKVIGDPGNARAREALGLASDLGGYAIMIGGTSGPHLTSFSLVDIVGHGTACGLMNPYYWVFYSKAIQPQLRVIGRIFRSHGFTDADIDGLDGIKLAVSVAEAMIAFEKSIGAPTKLCDIPGFSEEVHIQRALRAAKDPDLRMKLQNMPVAMSTDDIDRYMAMILRAAESGDLSVIREKP